MIKRIFFIVLICLLFISIYIIWTKKSNNLNVILISVDTLSADHMGVYGYKRDTTPHIDEFAKDAAVFMNTYTLFPITPQSFYTLFTGKEDFLKNDGSATKNIMDIQNQPQFLSEILKNHGFLNAAFVTNPVLGEIFPTFQKGFSKFEFSDVQLPKNQIIYEESFKNDYQNAKMVVNNSTSWLELNKKNRFFLWTHFNTPHTPYNPPSEYVRKFDPQYNESSYKKLLEDSFPNSTYLRSCTKETPSLVMLQQAINLYDAEILTVDEQIGNLIRNIKQMGLYDKSIIIIYSDHGEGFTHNSFGHGDDLYNGTTHIAFIIRDPRYPKSTVFDRYTSNKDILPTLLNLLQIRGYRTDGFDLSTFIKVPFLSVIIPQNPIIIRTKQPKLTGQNQQIGSNKYAVINNGYKYIRSLNNQCIVSQSYEELYNLTIDKKEEDNIASTREDILKKMRSIVKPYLQTQKKSSTIEKNKDILNKLKSLGY